MLLERTPINLLKGDSLTLGPFPVNDAAKSIELRADGSGQFQIRLEVKNRKGLFLWGGSVGSEDMGHARIGAGKAKHKINWLTQKLETKIRYYRNQSAFITVKALTDFTGALEAANSITIGTPASADGFGTSLSIAVDAGSGSDRVLVGGIWINGQSISTFTYNSLGMTAISGAEGSSGGARLIRLYRYIAPATGSHDLAATFPGAVDAGIGGIPLAGVDQTTPAENGTGANGSASPVTVDVTSATGDLVVDVMEVTHSGGGSTTAVGAGQTAQIDRENYDGAKSWGMSTEDGAASVTMSWTSTNVSLWMQAAASIKAASAGVVIDLSGTPAAAVAATENPSVQSGGTVSPAAVSAVAATIAPLVRQSSMSIDLSGSAAASAVASNAGPQVELSGAEAAFGTIAVAEGFGSTQSVAVDAGTSANRCVYGILARNQRALNGTPTYNGVAGTLVGEAINGTLERVTVYRWLAPATGSHTLAFSTIGDCIFKLLGIPVTGIDQTTPNDAAETSTGTGSPQSESAASASGDTVLAAGFVSFTGGGASITLGGSTTNIDTDTDVGPGSGKGSWAHYEDGAASVTMSASGSQWGAWAHIAINLNPASVSLPGITPAAVEAVAGTVNPTVVLSSMAVDLASAPASAVAATVNPTVNTVGGQIIPAALADAVAATVNPTVVIAFNTALSRTPTSAVAPTVGPIVQLGSLSLIPDLAIPNVIAATGFSFFLGGYVVLAWDASADATGYRIYYGTASANYNGTDGIRGDNGLVDASPIDVGNVLQFTIRNLVSMQNWYFVVTAYNAVGESLPSSELVIFVTTGLFIGPTGVGAVAAGVDPDIILGSLSLAPAVANGVAAAVPPAVLSTGGTSIVPQPADAIAGATAPSVGQSSMSLNLVNSPAFAVSASVNPTVVEAGGLTVAPAASDCVAGNLDPSVRLGSITLLMDNLPEIATAVAATVNPTTFTGFLALSPAAADAIAATVDPSLLFSNVVIPAAADAVASSVAPTVEFGSVAVVPAPADAVGYGISPLTLAGGTSGATTGSWNFLPLHRRRV